MREEYVTTFAGLIQQGVLQIGDGYRAKLQELGGNGPLFLRAGLLTERGLDWARAERFHEALAAKVESKLGRPGDTIITTKGNSIGRTGYVPVDAPAFVYSPHLSYWRSLDHRQLVPGFLRYWAQGPELVTQVRAMAHSTDMAPYLSLVDQRRLHISLPTPSKQNAIAEVLGTLDDKIDLNSVVSKRADQLWQLHLESTIGSWDVNGDSLPAGWHSTPLSSLARFVNGRNFTKDATGSGRMAVRIAELNSGPGGSTVYNDIDVPDEHVAHPGDLLFAWSGSLTVRRWFRPEAIVNQHIFKVIPASRFATWFVHGHLLRLLPWYRQVAAGKATTMGHIQRYHLDEPVLVPDEQTLTRLDAVCRPLWELALAAERESLVLAELRDTLLPKLLMGELRVGDVEKLASAS